MNRSALMAFSLVVSGSGFVFAQSEPPQHENLAPVEMVVTAETYRGVAIPQVAQKDVAVSQEGQQLQVTGWLPLRGPNSNLELYLLIDDTDNSTVDAHLDQFREFIERLPPTTAVGIAYMHNGQVNTAQAPTTDHNRAAQALRPPASAMTADANPYSSLSYLIDSWAVVEPRHQALRREVVMLTSGTDVFEDSGTENVYTEMAISDAQRAGVIVDCIYTPSIGHAGHSPSLIGSGQGFLAHLAEETGGEAYFDGVTPPSSFAPFLADLAGHLENQYRVTFLASPREGLQRVRFTTRNQNVELVAAYAFSLQP